MFRPFHRLLPLCALSLTLVGCGTIYSDVYSPKPNHFKREPEKPSIPLMPVPPAPGDTNPMDPSGSSSPRVTPVSPVVLPGAPEPLPGM